ncbi:unnamed protein product [Adineta steineri]|uniref:Uncharacterized protein n=1 Tax=Adineta steineri TaxID=433720 RepID=A0A818VHQ8_9BILA|nr:unnamed protein product [Adineta steineri]CAF3713341.1 unnamed protein product [Adineta steineri]
MLFCSLPDCRVVVVAVVCGKVVVGVINGVVVVVCSEVVIGIDSGVVVDNDGGIDIVVISGDDDFAAVDLLLWKNTE